MAIPQTTPVSAVIAPTSPIDSYPTHSAQWGHDGYRSVKTYAERDAIFARRREPGMLVFVREDRKTWRLLDDLVSWEEASCKCADSCAFDLLANVDGTPLGNTNGHLLGTTCEPIEFVRLDGDTMTGPLILSEEPDPLTDPPLQAANWQWVLDQINNNRPAPIIHRQTLPVDHLLLPHPFGRLPQVQVMDGSGRKMLAQVIPMDDAVDFRFEITTSFVAILS